jgi:penicillin-binding protein 2
MDLVLTLDLQLQQLAERLLAGQRGSIVALDPRNGQILAMGLNTEGSIWRFRPQTQ